MKNFNKKHKNHLYPHLKYDREVIERAYQSGLKTFNSMTQEERIKNGFGENGHAHPRRFYIFIDKYFTEIKYFMTEKERTQNVFPWVVATRSERMKALKITKIYFDLKQLTLKKAIIEYETYKIKKETEKLKNEYRRT